MSEDPRPWWASAADAEGLEDVDPIEAFRSSRRPSGDAADPPFTAAPDPAPADGPAAASDDAATGAGPEPAAAQDGSHRPELCGICPLCSLARSLEETRPELLEHLTEAARHLAAAARALVDAPAPPAGAASDGDGGSHGRGRGDPGAVHHIPVETGPRPAGATGANEGGGDPRDTDGAGDDG